MINGLALLTLFGAAGCQSAADPQEPLGETGKADNGPGVVYREQIEVALEGRYADAIAVDSVDGVERTTTATFHVATDNERFMPWMVAIHSTAAAGEVLGLRVLARSGPPITSGAR